VSETRNSLVSVLFKPVPGGYTYHAPGRWVFGPARYYLVNEAQKSAIIAVQTPRRPILFQILLWTTFLLMVAATGVIIWTTTGHNEPTGTDMLIWVIIVAIEVFAAMQLLHWRILRRLRPILVGAPSTDDRITYREMRLAMETSTNATSVRQLAFVTIASVFAFTVFLVCFVLDLAFGLHLSVFHLFGTVVFGFLSAVWFKRLIRKAEVGAAESC
jgi:hypothetical protein